MAIPMGDSIFVARPIPSIDYKYGPFASIEEVFESLGPEGDDILCIGLTVGIQENPDGPVVEYWFKDACEDVSDLVLKEPDLSRFVEDANYVHTDNNFTDEEKQKLEDLENYDDTQIVNSLDSKVDKVEGKQLSTEDYTTAEKEKLANIQDGGQENVLEKIKINGVDVPIDPTDKSANITLPIESEYIIAFDGVNDTFDLPTDIEGDDLNVTINGLHQFEGSDYSIDGTVSPSTIKFDIVYDTFDVCKVLYTKSV